MNRLEYIKSLVYMSVILYKYPFTNEYNFHGVCTILYI